MHTASLKIQKQGDNIKGYRMKYLQAGEHRLVALDPDHEALSQIAQETGYSCEIIKERRSIIMHVTAIDFPGPLLLFDASDSANLGWFSRTQFYVDSISGVVLQTPILLANTFDGNKILRDSVKLTLTTELPAGFRLPGRRSLTEHVVYTLLYNLLTALRDTGVAICGKSGIRPLTGIKHRFSA